MKVTETELKGCFIIEPKIYQDHRGLFFESFNKKFFELQTGLQINFVQDNVSVSNYGVIRGLHIQKEPYGQSKLVHVLRGKILDVVVDVRKDSFTFGKCFSIELSAENNTQLFIPRGFLHGFSVLEDNTIVTYKCDKHYHKEAEIGVMYNDKDLNIDWKLNQDEMLLSNKDLVLKTFKESVE